MQEIFNKVVTHLRAQGCKATQDGHCCYRTEDGKMCAVGCLLGDKYVPEMEGVGVTFPIFWNIFSPKERRLLSELQNIHDNVAVFEWELHFGLVADKFGLTIPL